MTDWKTYTSLILPALRSNSEEEACNIIKQLEDESKSDALFEVTSRILDMGKSNIDKMRKIDLDRLKFILKVLVENCKADPTVGWKTPLHLCFKVDDLEILKLFISNGVDLFYRDFQRNTIVHLACLNRCSYEVLEYLLTIVPPVIYNAVNEEDKSPLIIATENLSAFAIISDLANEFENLRKCVLLLLNCPGINVNFHDNTGRSVLFCIYENLCKYNDTDKMEELYQICLKISEVKADANLTNQAEQRFIHMALRKCWRYAALICKFSELLCGASVKAKASQPCIAIKALE